MDDLLCRVLNIPVVVNSITGSLVHGCFKLARAVCPGRMDYAYVAQASATNQKARLSSLVVCHHRLSGIRPTATNVAVLWLSQMAIDVRTELPRNLSEATCFYHHSG
eukprot:1109792-Amphidinium_carterae.2